MPLYGALNVSRSRISVRVRTRSAARRSVPLGLSSARTSVVGLAQLYAGGLLDVEGHPGGQADQVAGPRSSWPGRSRRRRSWRDPVALDVHPCGDRDGLGRRLAGRVRGRCLQGVDARVEPGRVPGHRPAVAAIGVGRGEHVVDEERHLRDAVVVGRGRGDGHDSRDVRAVGRRRDVDDGSPVSGHPLDRVECVDEWLPVRRRDRCPTGPCRRSRRCRRHRRTGRWRTRRLS